MKPSGEIALKIADGVNTQQLAEARGNWIQPIMARIIAGPVSLGVLHEEFASDLAGLYVAIQYLWQMQALILLNKPDQPDIAVSPSVAGEALDLSGFQSPSRWKLSRFACARREGDKLTLESPLACARVTILRPQAAVIPAELLSPVSAEDLALRCDWLADSPAASDLLFLLRLAAIVDPCNDKGDGQEDIRPDLMPWEFHDLLFHNRSRMGRHDHPMGAQFRFKGKLTHEPSVKRNPWMSNAIALHRPSPAEVALHDAPFSYVLETRRSNRDHHQTDPVSAEVLGEFLFRTARNRYHYTTEFGPFTSRPYPSGGGSYEFEIYLTVDRCRGIERGFHYYDPENHTLSLIAGGGEDVEGLLNEAWISSAYKCRPQVLITIASRFHRVAWKYSGMAYATQLKNIGVLLQTLYLVATAMSLAGCGLGLGNTARFCRLARTNYFEEGSIGEFMLGTPA